VTILYGGDYNPEQWPAEVWEEDVRLMREAGVNIVSLGIFSWARLEPAPGQFEFDWLDRVIELLHASGVRLDLATATASPPPWLSHRHPEMLPVQVDGRRLWPGARQHYCPSSPVYREAARALATAMAERYGKHPALAMWHVGNEYGCHVDACYCDVSATHFRRWLSDRYGELEELNRAWGTDFWSQRYSDWEEILPPRQAPTWPNPGQQLDFHRFCSDALLECYEIERAVLAEHSPGIPITTNFMRFFKPLDYWKWAEREDIVSDDVYQDPSDPNASMESAMAADLMRSLGRGRPWLLMEQTTSRVNWRPVNVPKRPGQMRLWSLQAVARGADGVMFFQWRQSRAGAEKFHSGMVGAGPTESSPVWKEVVGLGTELRDLGAVAGSRVRAEVAILHDWESWWALELPSKPSALVKHISQLESYYRCLFDANVTVDFARPGDDLAAYRLVLVPNLYLVSDQAASSLVRYAEAGGTVVMSYFSGIVDERDHIRPGGYAAPFHGMLGLRVEEFSPLAAGAKVNLSYTAGTAATGSVWSELVTPMGAETVASFDSGDLRGHPAITRNVFGRGTAYYLATRLDGAAMSSLLAEVCRRAGVEATLGAPSGVEAVRRHDGNVSFLFLLNHNDTAMEVSVPSRTAPIRMGPFGVEVLRE
jgi:beta-galactosidase